MTPLEELLAAIDAYEEWAKKPVERYRAGNNHMVNMAPDVSGMNERIEAILAAARRVRSAKAYSSQSGG